MTEAKKQNYIFNKYKARLIKERAATTGEVIRFAIIEYLCKYPKIDPYKMAKALILDGFKIVFDDAAITGLGNQIKRRKVYGK